MNGIATGARHFSGSSTPGPFTPSVHVDEIRGQDGSWAGNVRAAVEIHLCIKPEWADRSPANTNLTKSFNNGVSRVPKFARFMTNDGERFGRLEGERVVGLSGDIFHPEGTRPDGKEYHLKEVRLLAPCVPSKVVAVGLNYRDHAAELNLELPTHPLIFLKPPTTIVGPGDDIVYPEMSQRVDYEAELAVIIGKKARDVSPDQAREYIFGYTCANDVTARDLQKGDGQWTRSKSFDTFLPLGPVINTDLDPGNLRIRGTLNGTVRQDSSTAQMIFPVEELVSFVSRVMTLLLGDVIITGTPPGVGPMEPGDVLKVSIDGIGDLENRLVRK